MYRNKHLMKIFYILIIGKMGVKINHLMKIFYKVL